MSRPDHVFAVLAYGDSPFLTGCLTSLTAQIRSSPILVCTSTPSPTIAAAAAAVGAAVRINPERRGIAADWNFAYRATEARYVTLAHQDDIYAPAFAARSLALFDAYPQAAVAFTGYDEIDDAGAPRRSKISFAKHALEGAALGQARLPGRGRMRAFLALGNPLPCSSATFDRDQLGDFSFSDAWRSNLDWDAWLRLIEAGVAMARTPERLVGRRHNALTATSGLIRDGVRRAEDLAMFRRLWPTPLADVIAFAYRAGYSRGAEGA